MQQIESFRKYNLSACHNHKYRKNKAREEYKGRRNAYQSHMMSLAFWLALYCTLKMEKIVP